MSFFFHCCSLSVRADKALAVRYDGKLEVVALTVSVYHGIGIAMQRAYLIQRYVTVNFGRIYEKVVQMIFLHCVHCTTCRA